MVNGGLAASLCRDGPETKASNLRFLEKTFNNNQIYGYHKVNAVDET
jgi:hypothetical protein